MNHPNETGKLQRFTRWDRIKMAYRNWLAERWYRKYGNKF